MAILDLQIGMRELGRIRTGEQVASSRGKRPAKLDTFRLTSASRELIEAAAAAYGGTVEPWESPAGREWQVKTTVDALPIVIPPGDNLTQWYELWSGGGCQRRCDGRTETITDTPCGSQPTRLDGGKLVDPCPADPADRREAAQAGEACKPTTRLSVILPELPDLGVWRLESHGFYAAVELAAAARFLAIASSSGLNIPARLRLDQREKRMPGKPTNRYAVPIIEFTTTKITDLLAAGAGGQAIAAGGQAQLGAGAAQLPPSTVGQTIDPGPAPRKTKTERPPLGAAPGAPDGSDFRKPNPPAAAAKPATATTAEEPATVAGFVVEGQAVEVAPDPDPAAVDVETGEVVATASAGLTREALLEGLNAAGVDMDYAIERSKSLFPREAGVPLTDDQRGELLATLTTEAAQAAAVASL